MANREPSERGHQVLRALLEYGESLEKDVCTPGVAKNLESLGFITRQGRPRTLRLTERGTHLAKETTQALRERLARSEREEQPSDAEQPAEQQPVMSDAEFQEVLRKDVEACRADVAHWTTEEDAAYERCLALPVNDSDLSRARDWSIKAGSRREQAEEDLQNAEKDLRLFGSP